jgi:hypothetical protein
MTFGALEALIRREPIMTIAAGLSTAIITIFSFVPHFTPVEVAAIATITTAVTALIAAFLTQPLNIGAIHAALTTGLVAAATFGLRLSPAETGAIASGIVIFLNYLAREKLTPVTPPAVK